MTDKESWWIVVNLAMGVAVSNAFARFAYGQVMPAMQHSFEWTYAQAGWMNTVNSFGYLLGAVLVFKLLAVIPTWKVFAVGMLCLCAGLVLTGYFRDFFLLSSVRFASGVAGAMTFISGGSLVARLFPNSRSANAKAIALYFGGAGFGMLFSAPLINMVLSGLGDQAWPYAWYLLAALSLLLTPGAISSSKKIIMPVPATSKTMALRASGMSSLLVAYTFFAFGYIIYLTFMGALIESLGLPSSTTLIVWCLTGLGISLSPFLWGPVLSRFDDGKPLSMVSSLVAISTLIPALAPSFVALIVSAILHGLSIFIAPAAVTSFSKKNLDPALWSKAISLFTILFGLGQTVGPYLAGLLSDIYQGLEAGFIVATAVLAVSSMLALFQRPLSYSKAT